MLQHFTTMTIAFAIIGICGEIDGKYEFLVANGASLKKHLDCDIYILFFQVLLLYIIMFSTTNFSYL
jgi:hypothetical protein